ncbi:TonB-dependent receptor [Stenotrophomonas rhizophila]|uniref:TonB-dependent receptor n=1 Tax=Stenotrophomonas rhizophila TaxID=216778 RepID=UPI00112F2533|nr:TonB-dependent receptor [Stenotrophomonas rhizophila]
MTYSNHRNRAPARSLLTSALVTCLMLGAAPSLMAQSATSSLRGQVAQAEAGTEVTATNLASGTVRRATTRADGSYSLMGLDPGTYDVVANGQTQKVTVTVASTATLNFSGAPANGGTANATNLDTVNVIAPTLLQEVRTSEVGKTVSLQQIQTTPQVSRNFLEFADAVPGMIFTRDAKGNTSLRGGATNADGTNVYIDGVGQKSYVKGGGVAGQSGSAGNPFPQLAIGEYKVISGNYKAEYGQVSSAAVTAATKSGTNEFKGETFYRYTNEDMRAKTPAERQYGQTKEASAEKEYGFALGGPIIQDKAHFFVTYEAKRFDLPVTIAPEGSVTNRVGLLPGDAAAGLGPASQPFEQDLIFAKIDFEPTDNDRIELSFQDRDETQQQFSGQTAPEAGREVVNTDRRYALRWNHSGERYYNELMLTHEDSFNNPTPLTLGNGFIYTAPDGTEDRTLVKIGGASALDSQVKGQKGWAIEDNLTLDGIQWMGDHTIKMGAKYKQIDLYASDAAQINPQFTYSLGDPDFPSDIPYKAQFVKPVNGVTGVSGEVRSKSKQIGLFIQDDWQVNDHLQLNIGLRWDYEKTPAYLDFVTPQAVVDAIYSQDPRAAAGQTFADTLALGGLDISNYISNGHNRKAFKDAWQPRLGFSYDINADEQHVIHGGAGRSYDRDLFDNLQLETTKLALPQPTIYFRNPATGSCLNGQAACYDWNPNLLNGIGNLQSLVGSTSNAGLEVDLLNNNLKVPYSDQFSLGMSNQVGDWLTDATIARTLSYDGFAFTLGNRYPTGQFFDDPRLCGGTDPGLSQAWSCNVPGFGSLIIGQQGIKTRATQVLLSAQKPFTQESGWGSSIAYTWTTARHNRDINEKYAFDRGLIEDYPTIRSNGAPRHRLVVTGSYAGFWGITFGGKVTLATPTAVNDWYPVTQSTGYDLPTPGAAVPNGNGKFLIGGKIFGYRSVDLQATKTFKMPGDTELYARIDIINVFNFDNFSNYNYTKSNGKLLASYNETGDIVGTPRQVKAEVGFRF